MLFSLPPIPLGISHGVLFIGIWMAFVLCIIAAALGSGGFLKSIRESLSTSIRIAKTNFLYIMPLVASGLLTATILISDFQTTQGVQTGSLNYPANTSQYYILLNLAYAPLNEEFAFRITTIGIPIALILLISYRSHPNLAGFRKKLVFFFLTLFSPELAKSRIGHKTVAANGLLHGISLAEWALIAVTSFVFGYAHVLYGGGWEVGKVTTACLAGLVFGVMYVSYGAYADILLHWFFNYYFTVLDMASSAYGAGFNAFANIGEFATIIAGGVALVFFLVISAFRLGDNLSGRVVRGTLRKL
jgi:membrane protease YdiL (CAAX protease family)